jgi:PAS domain S-box-containing protein
VTGARDEDEEETLLRSVALQNAKTILLARQRAEEELVRAKEALELKTRELAHSLAMMRATLESTTDGILVTDGAGRVTGYNHRYAEIWGVPPEILDARDHRRLLEFIARQSTDPRRFLADVDAIYLHSPSETHDVLELADGRVVERFSAIQFVEEQNVGRVWSFRDITERRRAEEGLRKQSEWLRVTLASIGDAVITTDAEGRVSSLNPVAEALTGWTTDEARGVGLESVFRIVNEQSRQPAENPALRALREGQIVGLANHTVLISRDGAERAIDDSAAPIRDDLGHMVGVVLIFRDITERRRGEERLRQGIETTRFLADASATLAQLTDFASTLQRVASLAVPSFADWCTVDMLEVDGSIGRLAVTHTDPSKVQLAREVFRRRPPHPSDTAGIGKVLRSGEAEWLAEIPEGLLDDLGQDADYVDLIRQLGLKSYMCVPLRSRAGTLGVITFVTAESGRIYDATSLAAAEDLAQRAVIAIENANLLAALKDSDRRKDEFLAILAHELRNPLAPIRNAVHILRAKGPPLPELRWATDVIDRQVHQMSRLVDDLLDVSRIAGGKIQLRKERIDLRTVVTSAIEASRPLIDKWRHELKVAMPAEPVYLDGDLTRLSQVLLNLLNNAAKYTDRGGRIALTVEPEGAQVAIRVKDSGIGIPSEMLPHIFGMFTQVDRSLERAEGGLGIGLTLVQRLVELHRGTVKAYSEGAGKGSEFVVRLPVATGADAAAGSAHGAAAAEPAAHSTCRILIVDDNRDAADTLGLLLKNLGNEVHIAHDGLEALGAAEEFQPDVVLLDIGMPKMNGYDAARRIRAVRGAGVVLIAVTGWGQDEDRRRSAEAGFDHHLTKPVNLAALQALLATADRPA